MPKTPGELWLLELERERYDTSWRNPKPLHAPTEVIVRQVAAVDKKAQKTRDNIMFHAGRFAAGARDQQAIDANSKIGGLINGKGKL